MQTDRVDQLLPEPCGLIRFFTDNNVSIFKFGDEGAPYGGYFRGAYSYIIKPMASKKLINAVIKNGWVPADKQIGESLLKLQATSSTIVRIHPGYNYQNINKLSLTRNLHWNK